MRKTLTLLYSLCFFAVLATCAPPTSEIHNGQIRAQIYLPDAQEGFYRGTRFDWSGVIYSLKFAGHDYYGLWFDKTDPTVHDFIYKGNQIIAGPCTAITGPVDEFTPLGWDAAAPGGTFVKVGVGAIRKPNDLKPYDNFHLYETVDLGKWRLRQHRSSIEFTQDLRDPASGYGYVYNKTVSLAEGKPELVLRHTLKNTGTRTIETKVYNHNFLTLDHQAPGPGVVISLPFQIHTSKPPTGSGLAEIRGNEIVYTRKLQDHDTVALSIEGFKDAASYNRIRIENRAVGAGMTIESNRPLDSEALWSIRTVLAMEPFIAISIKSGEEFTWTSTYEYFTLPSERK
jgi:hypothetical protein